MYPLRLINQFSYTRFSINLYIHEFLGLSKNNWSKWKPLTAGKL